MWPECGLLTSGPLELVELLPMLTAEGAGANGVDFEWQALEPLLDHLEKAGYVASCVSCFRMRWGQEALLVVLVAVFFRQAVEADPDLFGELSGYCKASDADTALEDLRGLAIVLDRHRAGAGRPACTGCT